MEAKLNFEKVKSKLKWFLHSEIAVLVLVLAGLTGGMGVLTHGLSLTRANMMNIIVQSAMRGVASVGQAFVILTGGIDLSVGGTAIFSAVLGASIMTGTEGFPLKALVIMFIAGTGIGAINGVAISKIGMPPLIVTLSIWQIIQGITYMICQGHSIADLPSSISTIGQGTIATIPMPIIIFFAVVGISYFILNYTPFGRSIYAVGGNPVSAWLSGIKVGKHTFAVYCISGFMSMLAALIIIGRVGCASMSSISGLELDSIAAVTIGGVSLSGGMGNMIGVAIGVLILGVINNGINILELHPAYQTIIKGSVIFTAVAIDYIRRRR